MEIHSTLSLCFDEYYIIEMILFFGFDLLLWTFDDMKIWLFV
jgi:hypothetical protein